MEAYETAVEFLRLLKEKGFQAGSFDFSTPTTQQWIALFWWGIGPFGIGTMLWFLDLKAVKASTASGFMGAMPASE